MFAVWITFSKEDEEYLSKIIKKTSKDYNSPKFTPHITVYGLVDIERETIEKVVSESIKTIKPFLVQKKSISHSDYFWKTVFLEILQNDELSKINNQLTKHLKKYGEYEFKPHVSIIYKNMSTQQKEELVNKLDIKQGFEIDGICIQEFSENIEEWKIVKKFIFEKS